MTREKAATRPVIEIGPLPPPYGGVAVHLRRLSSLLAERGERVVVFCQEGGDTIPGVEVVGLETFSWRDWLRAGALRLMPRVVHCHEGLEWSPALLVAALRGARVVVTVHSERTMDGIATIPWYYRIASRLLLSSSKVRWIAVSAHIAEGLAQRGARAGNVRVSPAYLPLVAAGIGSSSLPADLDAFASAHHPLLTIYGWRADLTAQGADSYGFDLAIEAAARLRATWPECGLIVLVPSGEPSERVAAMRREIEGRDMADSVCVWAGPLPDPTPLWLATDVYLRPSRTDGDAISVREVLALGGTVVASDCAERPSGVRTFASGDPEALRDAVVEAMSAQAGTAAPDPDAGDALRAVAEAYGLPTGSLGGGPT